MKKLLFLLCACASVVLFQIPATATPPADSFSVWDDPVWISIVYPAGYTLNDDGTFEVEISVQARYKIKKLSLGLSHDEEVVLDKKAPLFKGSLKEGAFKSWRVTGRISKTGDGSDEEIPLSLLLHVEYPFPYEAVKKALEKMDFPTEQARTAALEAAETQRGKTVKLFRPFPLVKTFPSKFE